MANKGTKKRFRLPTLSSRILRTPLAVLVTVVIYQYLLGGRNPCFACIGAVYGIGSQFQEGFHNGFNRFVGTFVGGLLVIPFYYLYNNEPLGIPGWVYLVLGMVAVLWCNLALGADSAIQPGTVVYFVVMFTVGNERVVSYTIARIIDTGVGVLIALMLTMLHPTAIDRKKGLSFGTIDLAVRHAFATYFHNNRKSRELEHVRMETPHVEYAEAAPEDPFENLSEERRNSGPEYYLRAMGNDIIEGQTQSPAAVHAQYAEAARHGEYAAYWNRNAEEDAARLREAREGTQGAQNAQDTDSGEPQ